MKIYQEEKYAIENFDKYCRIYWSPSTMERDRKRIKEDLLHQRKGELVFEFRRYNNVVKLHNISSILQSEITISQFKLALISFYEKIRNCTCHREENHLYIFSEQKKIDINIKFGVDSPRFTVKGNDDNLVRFIHAYCDCVNSILNQALFDAPHSSQLASNQSLIPNNDLQTQLDAKSLTNLDLDEDIPISNQTIKESATNENEDEVFADAIDSFNIPETQEEIPKDTENNTALPTTTIPETPQPTEPNDTPEDTNQTPPASPKSAASLQDPFHEYNRNHQQILAKLDMIPELRLSIDSLNTTMKKIDARLFDAERNLEKHSERLDQVEKNVGRLLTNTVKYQEFNQRTSALEAEQKQIQNEFQSIRVKLSTETVAPKTGRDLEELTKQIRDEVTKQLAHGNTKNFSQKSQSQHHHNLSRLPKDLRGKLTEKGETIETLNHDLLIVGDSNTHPIRENILKHNTTAAKILTIKIDEAIDAIDNVPFEKEPKKILISVGTNHFSSNSPNDVNDENLKQAKEKLEELFGSIVRKFPTSDVYVSELFMRGEKSMAKYINEMNAFIKLACRHRSRDNFRLLMHSDNIDHPKHLKDDKHLSRIGFSIFLSAIRLQLFGMLPKYKQPHSRYSPRRY